MIYEFKNFINRSTMDLFKTWRPYFLWTCWECIQQVFNGISHKEGKEVSLRSKKVNVIDVFEIKLFDNNQERDLPPSPFFFADIDWAIQFSTYLEILFVTSPCYCMRIEPPPLVEYALKSVKKNCMS